MEQALNTPFPKEFLIPVFVVKLYLLPHSQSLLVLYLNASTADMASTTTIIKHIVSSLHKSGNKVEGDESSLNISEQEVVLPSVEDAISLGQANKPFWAHSVDVVGYGLVSHRHAYLPFDDTKNLRTSKLLQGTLTVDATTLPSRT